MAKFNTSSKNTDIILNYEEAKSYKLDSKLELYTLVCTSILADKFYETEKSQLNRLRKLIDLVPSEFVAKLAVYAREQMNLRTIPMVLSVELAKIHNGDCLVSKLVTRVIQRADELTEILSYYQKANQRNKQQTKKLNRLSKQISKGIANALYKFDEYKFAKYNKETEIKLKDVLFITHPKPQTTEQAELFKKIANNTLSLPYTWEVELSKLGQETFENETRKQFAFKEKWEELIDSKKLGYMALLRNLRNVLNANVSISHIEKIVDYLSNEKAVTTSKQLPFRYFSAYLEIKDNNNIYTEKILKALEKAVKISIDNIPFLSGSSLIACDVSGSMEHSISKKSAVQYYDLGLLLGQLLKSKQETNIFGIFGETWKVKNFSSDSILQNTISLHDIEGEVGYSTNGWKVIEWLINTNTVIDKIYIFTDNQMWNSISRYDNINFSKYWNNYKKINPKAELYLFDVSGYGSTPVSVKSNDVYLIAGWSEKIFGMLEAIKNGSSAIKEIENIVL